MTAIHAQYTREMRQRFGYTATWLPTVEVRLGDVGLLSNHEYVRVGVLADFGVEFAERSDRTSGLLEYASSGAVSFALKAAGAVPSPGSALSTMDAGIAVSFNADNAVMFQARECTTSSIDDQRALGQQLAEVYASGDWPRDYVVVTEVVLAERATILVSSGHGAMVELSGNAEAALGVHSLAELNAGLRAVSARNMAVQIIGEARLTPLFRAWGIARRLFRPPAFVRRGGASSSQASPADAGRNPPGFEVVDYDDFG